MADRNASNPLPTVRRSKFFFEDSMVVIQIQNVQFKVHKSRLIESETFADMFSIAKGSNASEKSMEGSIDNPIKLEGVAASDFECLLTLLYERHYTQQHPTLNISLALPAFRLAHMWNFAELRAYLKPHVERDLNDVDKIVYAREFGTNEWTTPAYIQLCRRKEPLTSQEAEKIGFKGAMLIFRIREEGHSRSPAPQFICSCGRSQQAEPYCDWCGTSKKIKAGSVGSGINMSEKDIEAKIKAWEKSGQVFTK